MREFQAIQKKQEYWSKIIHSRWFMLFLCVCIFFLGRGLLRIYGKYSEVSKEFDMLQTDVDNLKQRDQELDTQIQRIESPEGKDYEIRKKLDVAKPGEKTLYIIDTP